MQQGMLWCNGVQTQIISEGRWVEEGLVEGGKKDVVLIIPGNPGVPSFYKFFMKALKSKLPPETPVWVIGQAGHVQPPDHLKFVPNNDVLETQLYDLKGQVDHKIEFIKKYVPEDARLHIIGHSIGSWLILNVLKDDFIAKRVVKCHLLFPTVERMAESKNGKFLTNVILRLATFLTYVAWIFSFFPVIVQAFLVNVFGFFYGIPTKYTEAVLQLLDPRVLKRVMMLAKQEMLQVHEADHNIIEVHAKKLHFYYGSRDGWTPRNYYEDMKSKHPNANVELCTRGYYHTFMLTSDKEMGEMVGDWISSSIAE